MNDDIREKLSAYLDGALSEMDRKSVEEQLAGSADMRLELEALRAVSAAVKGLPQEKLPVGFMARLEARRSREALKPARDYFILPPAYRPLAFALSTAVVALVIWDKTITPASIEAPRVGWDSEKVAVKSAAEAPPSIDLSGQVSSLGGGSNATADAARATSVTANVIAEQIAKKEDSPKPASLGKHISAPGKPLGIQEADTLAATAGAAPSAPATAAPLPSQFEAAEGNSGVLIARNEEERSAINERLYKGFEEEKKRMGIARIMDKDAEPQNLPSGGREMMALQASPEAARVDSGAASVRGAAKAKRQSAPIVKAITLKSAEALQAAWAAAGLPGDPPAVKFPEQMAIFLAGPQGCGIVDVQARKKFIVVLYKDAGFDDASARVRAIPLSPKPVVIKLAQ